MTTIDTDEYRRLLEEERTRLAGAVEYLHTDSSGTLEDELGEIGGQGVDNHPGDMASATYDRELDEGLEEGAQQTLREIDAALQRIEDGTYGYCEETDEPIGVKRLDARPIATLSLEAQERHERMERTHRED